MDVLTTADTAAPGPSGPPAPVIEASPGSAPQSPPPLGAEQVENIEALLEYVAEAGLDKDGSIVTQALAALSAYRSAVAAGRSEALQAAQDLLRLATQLSGLTADAGISGRSIRSSAACLKHLAWMRVTGLALVAAAIGTELVGGEGALPYQQQLASYAVPFFWGAIGAIVFLMKTITDRASDLSFDERKLQGLPERILLGALCGTILVNLFGADGQGLTKAAIGFLSGLGTKAVYAGFETLVNGIADRVGSRKGTSVG